MPQLVRGGKHTFGWSTVADSGTIVIPPEAIAEYGLEDGEKLIVVPGSRTSGGFGLSPRKSVIGSVLGVVLEEHPELGEFRVTAGDVVEHEGRPYCWVMLRHGTVDLEAPTLAKYGVSIGDRLLVIDSSEPVRHPGFAGYRLNRCR